MLDAGAALSTTSRMETFTSIGRLGPPPGFPKAGRFLEVVDKLPYLVDLGVTAIKLLPIEEFPDDFSLGYNGTDTSLRKWPTESTTLNLKTSAIAIGP
jgi:glycosidase